MKKNTVTSLVIALCASCIIGINSAANADFMTVVDNIQRTSDAINSVNQAGRGIMSTTEFFQRFKDRWQDRSDRKRAEKAYNEAAYAEYNKTLQEINALQQQYYGFNYNQNL